MQVIFSNFVSCYSFSVRKTIRIMSLWSGALFLRSTEEQSLWCVPTSLPRVTNSSIHRWFAFHSLQHFISIPSHCLIVSTSRWWSVHVHWVLAPESGLAFKIGVWCSSRRDSATAQNNLDDDRHPVEWLCSCRKTVSHHKALMSSCFVLEWAHSPILLLAIRTQLYTAVCAPSRDASPLHGKHMRS